jgi:hypothetical protein
VEEEKSTPSNPVCKPITLPDFQNGNDTTLSPEQQRRLHELERVVERNLVSFLETGRALLEIRDSGLYKQHYATFELYLVRRWGISTSRGKELMRSTLVAENLLAGPGAPGGDAPLPPNFSEQSLRPLAGLSPELQCATWSLASRITEKPSHTVVSRIVRVIQQSIASGYGESTPRPQRQESENTVFLRVVYKLFAMEGITPQFIVSSITEPAQARRCVLACREVARRCHFVASELTERFPGIA